MAYPPDINYRPILCRDQGHIKWLFKDSELRFKERFLKYPESDVNVKVMILFEIP